MWRRGCRLFRCARPVITMRSPLLISFRWEGFPLIIEGIIPPVPQYTRGFPRYRSSKMIHPFTVGMPLLFPRAQRRALRLRISFLGEEARQASLCHRMGMRSKIHRY